MAHRIVIGIVMTAVVLVGSPTQVRAAKPSEELKKLIEFDFADAPLMDAMEYFSDLTGVPIKLDPKFDGKLDISAKSSGKLTFRQSLTNILRPYKLTFRVDKADTTNTIVTRKPKK